MDVVWIEYGWRHLKKTDNIQNRPRNILYYLYCWWFNSPNVGAISRFSRRSLGAVLFVMLGGRYPFDGKAMPLEVQHMQQWMRIFPDFSTEKRGSWPRKTHWNNWDLASEDGNFMDFPWIFNHWSLGWNEEDIRFQWISHDWTRIIRRIYAKIGDWTNNTGDVSNHQKRWFEACVKVSITWNWRWCWEVNLPLFGNSIAARSSRWSNEFEIENVSQYLWQPSPFLCFWKPGADSNGQLQQPSSVWKQTASWVLRQLWDGSFWIQPEYMSRLAGCAAKHILFAGPCAVHVRYGVDLETPAIRYSDVFAECRYEHIWLFGGFKHFLFSTIYGIILPID